MLLMVMAPLVISCAANRPGWPPPPGGGTARILVHADHYHSILALPRRPQGSEEWAFGERIWFYEEKDTAAARRKETMAFIADALRALFWPNRGVIEVSKADKPYAARNPENKVRTWEVPVSEDGLRRMQVWLEGSVASRKALFDDGWQVYFPAAQRYHVLHTCHHYVARALREAGVPVRPGYCFLPSGLWMQLDRLSRRAARHARR